ncbi:MAG: LacI family DNA-binding transcriptional regulator [Shewanella sp.]|nr:LacI family DNA-binding transcriptional regulator [Shewanella sp.]MCF1431233.1 LacI family DNA-binding transcriptional regulator [Shewanella sp.]MCF1439519.1 LacI family DNA-binding transcriptional regulator [Shewanella sp.]MCF1458287.1 LacI family DNA-binding transcriptional regulator [Shewanella sp.]
MITKGKATSIDIAYLAGVSQSTVSRALRNSPLVKPETVARIQQIAKELNYKVDKHASSLRTQQSSTLALLLFEDPTSDDSLINPFFLSMLGSITRACAIKGYDLLVSFQQLSDDWHADYEDSHKADGIILLGYGDDLNYRPKLQQLDAQGTRYVRWGANSGTLCVNSDNRQGGRLATDHLIKLGHRRIAFIGDASNHYPELFARYQGHAASLLSAGIPLEPGLQIDAITTEESGYQAACFLLDSQSAGQVSAIFAASDLIAIGTMQALTERGLIPGKDVAIVGFDDLPLARFTSPALTTVRQNTKLAGEMLVDKLISRIHDEKVQTTTIATELIVRSSCGAQPGKA